MSYFSKIERAESTDRFTDTRCNSTYWSCLALRDVCWIDSVVCDCVLNVWSKKECWFWSPRDRYSQHATRGSARLLETSDAPLAHETCLHTSMEVICHVYHLFLWSFSRMPLTKMDMHVKTMFGTASEVVANDHRLSSIRLRGTPSHLICLAELSWKWLPGIDVVRLALGRGSEARVKEYSLFRVLITLVPRVRSISLHFNQLHAIEFIHWHAEWGSVCSSYQHGQLSPAPP